MKTRSFGSPPLLSFVLSALVSLSAMVATAAERSRRSSDRGRSIEAVCRALGVGEGAVIADVGCGAGDDSLAFGKVVGPGGAVFAEEIDPDKLKTVLSKSLKQGLNHIVPVLGHSRDPRLPNDSIDLIYMRHVFHHFAQPRAMLRNFWHDLKPGGFLVIVDREKGPLKDWVPMEERENEHHWTSETAVTRMAREEGFLFHDALDHLWREDASFVLVFRRPENLSEPNGDPDLPPPFEADSLVREIPLPEAKEAHVLFVGIDRGRALLPVLRQRLKPSVRLYDVVLEEWALANDELPQQPNIEGARILRSEKGELVMPGDLAFDLVVFVDSYHRLWEPEVFLRGLKRHTAEDCVVVVVDRSGPADEARRLGHHRRRIAPSLVRSDMAQAGFECEKTASAPEPDRFTMIFRRD